MPTHHADYDAYWSAYLAAHSKPATRACHYIATVLGITGGVSSAVTLDWRYLVGAVVLGYVIAISSHFAIEKNRPLVNRPVWGAISDLRMCALALSGKLRGELRRVGQHPATPREP